MAYNLPPPWDPGFALPDNVRDEGLERRGFVTKQMPRGTYDAPEVGTGGYAVPQYVLDEGYGQGTYTTKMLPRGYVDNAVPHFLNRRPRVLADRKISGRTRAVTLAPRVMTQPFNRGSAVAISGDDLPPQFTAYGQRAADILLSSVSGLSQAQAKARLKKMMDKIDPTLWSRTADLTRGYMAQGYQGMAALRAGLSMALSSGIAAEIVRTGLSRTAPQPRSLLGLGCYGCMAALGADREMLQLNAPAAAPREMPVLQIAADPQMKVGPWLLSIGTGRTTYPMSAMSAEQKKSFATAMAKAAAAILGVKTLSHSPPMLLPTDVVDLSALGFGNGRVPVEFVGNGMPLFKFTHPATGKTCVVIARSVGTKTSPAVELWWYEDKSLAAAIISALVELVATVVNDVLDAVGSAACQMLGSTGIAVAGAAAGTAAGVGPAAGAAGVSIAQQACGQPAPPQPIITSSSSGSMLPVAIIGGAALLAILVSSSSKKSVTP